MAPTASGVEPSAQTAGDQDKDPEDQGHGDQDMNNSGDENAVQPNQNANDVFQIVSDGDLILVVDRDCQKMQLTMDLFCNASTKFTDLLKHRMDSKAPASKDGILEIVLPDDNARTVRNAFSTLYPVGNDEVYHLKPEEIYDVARFACKYEMVAKFQMASALWFRKAEDMSLLMPYGVDDCYNLMMAAYWIRSSDEFFHLSKLLITHPCGLSPFGLAGQDTYVDRKVCAAIHEARQSLIRQTDRAVLGLCLYCFDAIDSDYIRVCHKPKEHTDCFGRC